MDFCWVTINVRDMEKSLIFYRDELGLELRRHMKAGPGTEIAFLGSGPTQVELIRNDKNDDCAYGKDISIGFKVASLDNAVTALRSKGVALHSGPFSPNPTISFAYVLDPNGLKVQLVEDLSAPAEKPAR